jgi:hypothetical protein
MKTKKCTCPPNGGCTDNCDREKAFWDVAIDEARTLPPTGRKNTLDWLSRRIRELYLKEQP